MCVCLFMFLFSFISFLFLFWSEIMISIWSCVPCGHWAHFENSSRFIIIIMSSLCMCVFFFVLLYLTCISILNYVYLICIVYLSLSLSHTRIVGKILETRIFAAYACMVTLAVMIFFLCLRCPCPLKMKMRRIETRSANLHTPTTDLPTIWFELFCRCLCVVQEPSTFDSLFFFVSVVNDFVAFFSGGIWECNREMLLVDIII